MLAPATGKLVGRGAFKEVWDRHGATETHTMDLCKLRRKLRLICRTQTSA